MTIALIADAHLGSRSSDVERFLKHLADIEKLGISELILMGDIFHFYIGLDKWSRYYPESLFTCLLTLKERGVKVVYLEGNRDFFLKKSPLESSVSLISLTYRFSLDGKVIHTEHGDLINREDRWYFFWRSISKSRMILTLLHLLPAPFLLPWVKGMERNIKKTRKKKRKIPLKQVEDYSLSLSGADLVITGHFHYERVLEIAEKRVIMMPDWQKNEKALLIDSASDWKWHSPE